MNQVHSSNTGTWLPHLSTKRRMLHSRLDQIQHFSTLTQHMLMCHLIFEVNFYILLVMVQVTHW